MNTVSQASPPHVAVDEPTPPDEPDDTQNRPEGAPINIGNAVASYGIQWLFYWLLAAGALLAGPNLGAIVTALIAGKQQEYSATKLETYRLLALAPDQAFAALAVLMVVVLTLSSGFSDSAVGVDPDVAYVRYRVQTWLLALAGTCCNAIGLMLGLYAAVNWGSTDSKFQTALLPLALATAVAASLLSIGRERQMQLETVKFDLGIRKLEKQHKKATEKWDRHWRDGASSPSNERIVAKPFLRVCCVLTAMQILVLLLEVLIEKRGLEAVLPAIFLAIIEIILFSVLPLLAVMTTVANILRRQEVSERLFKTTIALVYPGLLGVYTQAILVKVGPQQSLPHLILPVAAVLTLMVPLLLPLFRRKLALKRTWLTYALFAVQDLQRTWEDRTERGRRTSVEARVLALKVDLERRRHACESAR